MMNVILDRFARAYSLSCQEALIETAIDTIDLWRINNEDQISRDPVGAVEELKVSIRNTDLITE